MKILSTFIITIFFSFMAVSQTVGLIQHHSGSLDDGYVLFAPNANTTTYLIDKCGNQVHSWQSAYRTGQSCYLLNDGSLLRTGNTNNSIFTAGGTGGIVEKIDWNGNVTWSYSVSDASKCQHHDVKVLPNGNVLILAWELKTITEAIAAGRNPSLVPTTIWSEQILEIQPIGTNGGTVVWEWHLWDHLVQDYDATKANFGAIATNPYLLDINYAASATNEDWIHLNSIDYNDSLDHIVVSSHNMDEVWIIDHSTTTAEASTHLGGNSSHGGDLIYRWGNPEAYGNGSTTDKKLFGQHNVYWIPTGYPFGNQLMIFNNGVGRPAGNYSTVEIINPPVNGFNYTATLPYLPTATSWNYNYGNSNNLYSQNISGAQQLQNGNVLICSGADGTFTEATTSGNVVWKYINPVNNTGIINQGSAPLRNSVFRSTFYPSSFVGFAGKLLISNGTIENDNTVSDSCKLLTGINEIELENNVLLYPNPTSNWLTIKGLDGINESVEAELIDITGRTVLTQTLSGNSMIRMNLKDITNGTYLLRLTFNQKVVVKRMVKW